MSAARQSILIKDCGEKMVIVSPLDFVLHPIYFEWKFSETPEIFLREGAIKRLFEAKKSLRKISGAEKWNIKIWDGYRTLKIQKILYDNYYDILKKDNPNWNHEKLCEHTEMFVAHPSPDPKSPSPHNTGGVIDLTIVNENGEEIPMGSKFDEFNEKSFSDHYKNSEESLDKNFQKNRLLLKEIMESADFVNYPDEWWHFSYGDQLWAYLKKEPYAVYGRHER